MLDSRLFVGASTADGPHRGIGRIVRDAIQRKQCHAGFSADRPFGHFSERRVLGQSKILRVGDGGKRTLGVC